MLNSFHLLLTKIYHHYFFLFVDRLSFEKIFSPIYMFFFAYLHLHKINVNLFIYREAILTCLTLSIIIIITILGNILVILSVIKYPPLNVVSNYFIVSLALADLMVSKVIHTNTIHIFSSMTFSSSRNESDWDQ